MNNSNDNNLVEVLMIVFYDMHVGVPLLFFTSPFLCELVFDFNVLTFYIPACKLVFTWLCALGFPHI